MSGYIYLLIEREFIKTHEPIYKIGETERDPNKRFIAYPKDSIVLFCIMVNRCLKTEKNLIKEFKLQFKQRLDIGLEYFEGSSTKMINTIIDYIINNDLIYNSLNDDTYSINDCVEGVKVTNNKKEGLSFTDVYSKNENIKSFLLEKIEKTKNNNDFLTVKQLYEHYNDWDPKSSIGKIEFGKQIENIFGPKKDVGPKYGRRKGWSGIKISI